MTALSGQFSTIGPRQEVVAVNTLVNGSKEPSWISHVATGKYWPSLVRQVVAKACLLAGSLSDCKDP